MAQKVTERVIVVNFSGFTFILALEFVLTLVGFAEKAFAFEDLTKSNVTKLSNLENSAISAQSPPTKDAPFVVNHIEVDLNKMEIILLESLDKMDVDGLVFNCFCKISLRMEEDKMLLNGQVQKISMALINYSDYIGRGEVDAYIMSPVDLNFNGKIQSEYIGLKVVLLNFFYVNL